GTAKVPEGCKLVPIDSLVNLRNGLITARAYLDGFYLDGKSPRNPLALHKLPTDLVHGAIREIDAMLAAAPSPYGNEEKGE
ncbi:MAG: hypothetical protein U0990_10015, partial [Candidatus Nanopelagicales bacterium]|nr:hypothetical protein [Candidatus Nanopelagicales bacterium]